MHAVRHDPAGVMTGTGALARLQYNPAVTAMSNLRVALNSMPGGAP
jgi:hypothetical protein